MRVVVGFGKEKYSTCIYSIHTFTWEGGRGGEEGKTVRDPILSRPVLCMCVFFPREKKKKRKAPREVVVVVVGWLVVQGEKRGRVFYMFAK